MLSAAKCLLDSDRTTLAELEGYLALMHAAVGSCKPAHVGSMLPDILDLLLGWALDESAQPTHWYSFMLMSPYLSHYYLAFS